MRPGKNSVISFQIFAIYNPCSTIYFKKGDIFLGKPVVPPKLHFVGYRPSEEERIELIESLAEKRRIPRKAQAISLFLFYTELDEGFRPSEVYIEKSMQMSKNSFVRARKNLDEYGLIFWDKSANRITVDFETLYILDSLPVGQAGLYSAANKVRYQREEPVSARRTIGERNMYVPGYLKLDNLSESEKHVFEAINKLTPKELCEFWGLEYRPEIEEAPEDFDKESVSCPSDAEINRITRKAMMDMGYDMLLEQERNSTSSARYCDLVRLNTELNHFVMNGYEKTGEFSSYVQDKKTGEFLVTSPVKEWGSQKFDSDGKFLGDREDPVANEWLYKLVPVPDMSVKAQDIEKLGWVAELKPVRDNPDCDIRKYIDECRKSPNYVFDPGYSFDTETYKFFFDGKWTCFDKKGNYVGIETETFIGEAV